MSQLKGELTKIGYENVVTYLNSGNIVLESSITNKETIKTNIEEMIKETFELDIPVFVMRRDELDELLSNQPKWWGLGNKEMYDNIIFVIPPTTYNEVYNVLKEPKEELEQIQEYKNNIFRSYHLKEYRKTNWWSRTANTNVANKITIRTANTMKKVLAISNRPS